MSGKQERSETFIRDKIVEIIDLYREPENYVLGDFGSFIRDLISEGINKDEIVKQMVQVFYLHYPRY